MVITRNLNLVGFVIVALLKITDGLDCFSCIHVEGLSDADHINLKVGLLRGHSELTGDEAFRDTCGAVRVGGKTIETHCMELIFATKFGLADTRILVRGCLHTDTITNVIKDKECPDKSKSLSFEQVRLLAIGPMKRNLDELAKFVDDPLTTTNSTFCSCEEDLCNSSSKTVLFSGFLILPVIVTIFMKIY